MSRKPLAFFLTVFLSVLSLQNCITLLGKKTQGVTVTASPAGARVVVDGRFEGVTPLGLRLAKKPPHVIRIEKEGYRPVEIRLKKSENWFAVIFPNLIWAPLILPFAINPDIQSSGEAFQSTAVLILGFAAPPTAIYVDARSAKSDIIEPRHLSVTLEKDAGGGEPVIINIDAKAFRTIYWISVLGDDTASRR